MRLETDEPNRLASARTSLDLKTTFVSGAFKAGIGIRGEYDPAYSFGNGYDPATVADYERRLYLIDTFASLSSRDLEVIVGRRIVVWGENDVISPLDVVVPKDLREPGLADIIDLRLPVLMTEAAYYAGYHRLEAIVVHEADFGFRSPPGGPFSPFEAFAQAAGLNVPAVPLGVRFEYAHDPRPFSLQGQQFFARWVYQGPGSDVAIYGASALDQLGAIRSVTATIGGQTNVPFNGAPSMPQLGLHDLAVNLEHSRYELAGASFATSVGAWVFKAEARAQFSLNLNTVPRPGALAERRFDLCGGSIGVAYSGFTDTRIVLEAGKDWVVRPDPRIWFPVDVPALALRVRRTFLRDLLSFEAVGVAYGWLADHGAWLRVEGTYDLGAAWAVGAGFMGYHPTHELSPIAGFSKHDQVYVKLRVDL